MIATIKSTGRSYFSPVAALISTISNRLRCKQAERSIELYEMGLSREACFRITGIDPVEAKAEELARSALWGALVGGVALALLLTVWVIR